jgi:predicted phosphodiesterase
MRIAVLNDIHGNAPALKAVLVDVARAQADLIVCGGDTVCGPMPRETLALLNGCGIPVRHLRGNAEREVLMAARGEASDMLEQNRAVAAWTAEQLTRAQLDAVAAWPLTIRIEQPALGRVLFCHATPDSDEAIFTRITPEHRLRPVFDTAAADLVLCGHTHMQFDRRVGHTRVVNAGSVGMSYDGPGAAWALLDDDATQSVSRRTLYDTKNAAAQIRATAYPLAEDMAVGNVLSTPAEADVLALFESRALGG